MIVSGDSFSDAANGSVMEMYDSIEELYRRVLNAYLGNDRDLMKYAHEMEQAIDAKAETMGSDHIVRMREGICSANVGSEFLML